jgi:hypothetical protein
MSLLTATEYAASGANNGKKNGNHRAYNYGGLSAGLLSTFFVIVQ